MYLKFVLLLVLCDCLLCIDLNKFRCGEGFDCEAITCEKVTSCPGGRIVQKASYCNCCDKCIYEKDNTETECRKEQMRRLDLRKKDYSENLWIPECDKRDGSYVLAQKKQKKIVCVDANGSKLFGQDISKSSQNMTCKCSQHLKKFQELHKDTYMTKPQEHCTASGDFDRLQCIGNICYCANPETGDMEGRVVLMDHIDKLPCYKSQNSYVKPCEKELIRIQSIRYQFRLKGLEVFGLKIVKCDLDGAFSPTQCDTSRCSCTDKNGAQIRSYYTDDYKKEMLCECARDNEQVIHSLKCNSYGNYNLTQCFQESHCFCVDGDGDVISRPFTAKADDSYCQKLLLDLEDPDEEDYDE